MKSIQKIRKEEKPQKERNIKEQQIKITKKDSKEEVDETYIEGWHEVMFSSPRLNSTL